MNTSINLISKLSFIRGGGEMGALIKDFKWENSELGTPDQWPQSLKTTLGILLNAKLPMILFWGEHLVQFYNDAYLPSLLSNGKHPIALGTYAAHTWQDSLHSIKPIIEEVRAGGEATVSENQLITVYKNGSLEDVYWSFSFTPVTNTEGAVEGVLVICTENTEQEKLYKRLQESNDQLQFAIDAAELGTFDYNPATNTFLASHRFKEWFGLENKAEINAEDGFASMADEDRERVADAIERVMQYESGGHYDIQYSVIHPVTNVKRYVHAKGRAWFNEHKNPYRFNGTVQDITEQKKIENNLKASEEQFRHLANSIPQLAWMANADGYIYWYNQRWYDYTGTTLEEMVGWDWQKVHHPDSVEDVTIKFKNALAAGIPYEQTFLIKSKEGEYRWFLTRAIPIHDNNGKLYQWFGTNTDVTDQRKIEDALKESENKFRGLVETLPLLVWVTDEYGKADFASKSWEVYSGLDPYKEGSWEAIVHPEDLESMNNHWKQSLATGELYHAEIRLKNRAGEFRWHVAEGVPIKYNTQRTNKWIGAFTDIQEQKLKEQKKDEFISIASHEMKTPLTTVKGYLDLLHDVLENDRETALLYANKANHAADRLNKLITELLDASRIQLGKMNYNISTFDFDTMLKESVENIQHISKDHQLALHGKIEKEISGDRERLQQVIVNLLNNAIKYSPGKKSVIITVSVVNDMIQVAVQDFGVGIPKQHLEKLFERYYRVDEHSKQFQGLGIGLYISCEIITRHHGKMWVESKTDEGSTFYFTLPVLS